MSTAPQMIKDRKYHLQTHESCLVGQEMVDWLIHLSPIVHSRSLAIGMWQALLEEGAIAHVYQEHYFKDKYLFYRFMINDDWKLLTNKNINWDEYLKETIILLAQIGQDANLRMILRKP
jgi:Rap guanine nucleotide exchange factor 4